MSNDAYRDDDAADFAPNPRASQAAAARARRALGPAPDAPPVVRQYPLKAYGAGAAIALLIGMMSYQLGSGARPLQLPTSTSAPAQVFGIPPVTSPAPFSATPTEKAGIYTPTPTAIPLGLPVAAPVGDARPAVQRADWTQSEVAPAPEIAPEPTATIVWPTSAPANVADFAKPDIRATCAFIGCVGGELAANLARANECHALFWVYEGAEDMPEPDYSAMRACVWEGLYR